MIILRLKYVVPIEQIETYIEAHREFLHSQYEVGTFLASGPLVPRTGGIIIAYSDDPEEIKQVIQQDPFYQHGLAEYEFIQFKATLYDDRLKELFAAQH